MIKKKECKQCDLTKVVRLGRAHYICKKCGKDVTLMLVLMEDMKRK